MNNHIEDAPEVVRAHLALNVTYLLNGETAADMLANLQHPCEHAIGNGLLTGETAAKVDEYTVNVSIVPAAPPFNDITDYMNQRIADGDLSLEDILYRLVRYGLMEPLAFIAEMRERMGLSSDD